MRFIIPRVRISNIRGGHNKSSTDLFIILSFLVRHQNKGQGHLFGKFTGSNKCIDVKELLKGMSHKLEGAIKVPGLGSGQYG